MGKKLMLGLLGAAVLAAAAAVAIGSNAGASGTTTGVAAPADVVAAATPAPRWSTHPEGQWQQLMKNKAFRDEYFALRRTQLDDQQAWWDKHASDPQSSAAQTAWRQLHQKEQTATAALFKKYGVTVPAAPEGLQQLQQLRDNAKFRSDAAKLAGEFKTDMQAWFKQYGSDPRSSGAQAAMDKLRAKYESELKALLKKYGVTITGDLPLGILGHGLMGGRQGGDWSGGGMMDDGFGRGGFHGGPDDVPGAMMDAPGTGVGTSPV